MAIRKTAPAHAQPRPRLPPSRRATALVRGATGADIKANPESPTISVPWQVIAIALGAAVWFVLAAILFYGNGRPAADYLLWIAGGFAIVFFGLTLRLASWAASDPRWRRGPETSLAESVEANVALATGVVAGREALVQLLVIPVSLAIGATVIGIVFRVIS